jgi:hypothetical protein
MTLMSQPRRIPWSDRDDALLARAYGVRRTAIIARHLGRTVAALNERARVLKLAVLPRWTAEQDSVLVEQRGRLTAKEIGRGLGRSAQAVQARMQVLELTAEYHWSEPAERLLVDRWPHASMPEIAAELGCSPDRVRNKARALGLRKRPVLSAEAEAVLWEMREVDGVVQWFATEFRVDARVVARRMREMEAAGGAPGLSPAA